MYRSLIIKTSFFFSLLVSPQLVGAQVFISEIMYDLPGSDTGREWIEISNTGGSAVDLSTYKLFENGSNHSLNAVQGGTSLASGRFAIIADDSAKFLIDWPGFSGIILDSVFSLNNTGETISLKNGELTLDEVTYTSALGGNGDGKSLQKSGTTWAASTPTPGQTTAGAGNVPVSTSTPPSESASASPQPESGSSGGVSTHYGATPLTSESGEAKFKIGAGRSRIASTGAPIEFRVESNTEDSRNVTYLWSFGDGSTKYGEVVTHFYKYPGDYTVVLNARSSKDGQAVSRASVKVVREDLSVTSVSKDRVEITNNSTYEVNLYGRALISKNKTFAFPQDTILKGGVKISFPSQITGIYADSSREVSLVTDGEAIDKTGTVTQQLEDITRENQDLERILEETKEKVLAMQKPAVVPRPTQEMRLVTQTAVALNAFVATSTVEKIVLPDNEKSRAKSSWLYTIKRFFLGR